MSGIDWSKKDLGWVPMVEIYGTKMVEIDSIETIEVFLTIWNLTWRENHGGQRILGNVLRGPSNLGCMGKSFVKGGNFQPARFC